MARVNVTIKLFREEKTWDGNVIDKDIGEYKGWMEEGSSLTFIHTDGKNIGLIWEGQGTLFLWDDLDLSKCFFMVDGKRRDIVRVSRFEDGKGRFHHLEVIYK